MHRRHPRLTVSRLIVPQEHHGSYPGLMHPAAGLAEAGGAEARGAKKLAPPTEARGAVISRRRSEALFLDEYRASQDSIPRLQTLLLSCCPWRFSDNLVMCNEV